MVLPVASAFRLDEGLGEVVETYLTVLETRTVLPESRRL
jgi:hypothetical protein